MEIVSLISACIGMIFWLIVIGLLIATSVTIYFLPSIFAYKRKNNNWAVIIIVNAFFGWSGVGWIAAWIMALWRSETPQIIHHYNHEVSR
ncbi:MAG: superinfection immunity protein [Vampirovibrionales bacterium]|nr:superinfection immunity protein [Vampirovibrionales bacterium]